MFIDVNHITIYRWLHLQSQMEPVSDIYTEQFPPQKEPLAEIARYFDLIFHSPVPVITDQEIMAEHISSNKSNTILMDVLRTRSSFFSKEVKLEMEKMLNHFCRLNKLDYKQGLNEILAPFAHFREVGYSISKCYTLFKCFFDTYCLNFYYDKDFNSLEIIFKMVTVVIKYHDPALARYLENYQIEPQIYCIGWLMTMFSSKLSLRLTYILWQFLITERDDYFIFFLIVAIIIVRKESIIQTKNTSIFTIITNLLFRNEAELTHAIKVALLLRRSTPASLILFFKETRIFREKKNFDRINSLLKKVDKINVFLVSSGEISLREHLKLGLCERHCYFCSLREPLKIPMIEQDMKEKFTTFKGVLDISNDLRTMNFSIQFVVVDIRNDKSTILPPIQGLNVYSIDINESLAHAEAGFNQNFMELKGHEHFLFILNEFTFQKMDQLTSKEFEYCKKFIKILNSYSFNYLAILEGGEQAYFDFLHQNKMKSQLLNSKLVPVSELVQESCSQIEEKHSFLNKPSCLLLSEILDIQKLYDSRKLHFFQGTENSQNHILIILEGMIVCIEKNKQMTKLLQRIRQRKAVLSLLIEEAWTSNISMNIIFLHSIFLLDKLTVRLHHNNCLVLYLKESSQENLKNYRQGQRAQLWRHALQEIIREDLDKNEPNMHCKRVNFDTISFQTVKEISQLIKQNYKEMVRVKKHVEEEMQRNEDLNNNVIQDYDFSHKGAGIYQQG